MILSSFSENTNKGKGKQAIAEKVKRLEEAVSRKSGQLVSTRAKVHQLQVSLFNLTKSPELVVKKPLLIQFNESTEKYQITKNRLTLSYYIIKKYNEILDMYPRKNPIKSRDLAIDHVNTQIVQENQSSNVDEELNEKAKNKFSYLSKLTPIERIQRNSRLFAIKIKKPENIWANPNQTLMKSVTPILYKTSVRKPDEDWIYLLERDLNELKIAVEKIQRRFGSINSIRISNLISVAHTVNTKLKKEVIDITHDVEEKLKRVEKLRAIVEAEEHKIPQNRIENEAKDYYDNRSNYYQDLVQQQQLRIEHIRDINYSIDEVAQIFDPKFKESNNTIKVLKWIQEKVAILKPPKTIKFAPLLDSFCSTKTYPTSDNPNDIPSLPLSNITEVDFLPQTRSTRRLFSASIKPGKSNNNVEQEMEMFGKLLGNVFIERYTPLIHKFDDNLIIENHDIQIIEDKSTPSISEFFQLFYKNKTRLHLTLLTNWEIEKVNANFLKFISARETLSKISNNDFIKALDDHLNNDLVVCLWAIRDICDFEDATIVLQKLIPLYVKRAKEAKSLSVEELTAWAATLYKFYSYNSESINQSLNSLNYDIFIKLAETFTLDSLQSDSSKNCILSVLLLAKYLPKKFLPFVKIKGHSTSFIHKFIQYNRAFPTYCKAATDFFIAARQFINEETLMWHTAVFYHFTVSEIIRSEIREQQLVSYLSALISIIKSRDGFTVDQSLRYYILQSLIGQFRLEEDLMQEPSARRSEETEKKNDTPIEVPALSLTMPKKISYHEIPQLGLNFDNPKLQLQFQKTPVAPLRSSINQDSMEYIMKRNKFPIYTSICVHTKLIELLFSTIIDPKLHRLDVNYCDPFPHVNKKPNILFTIMQHMECNKNDELIKSLQENFAEPEILNDLPTVPHIDIFRAATVKIDDEKPPLLTRPLNARPASTLSGHHAFLSTPNFFEQHEKSIFETINMTDDFNRLLRLLVPTLFNIKKYGQGKHVANGAFGSVMVVNYENELLAVKILKKSMNVFDNPHLFEVYTEVSILERCQGDRRVTQLIDYGCTSDSYYIVMEYYPTTLKSWRKKQENPEIPVLLRLYHEFLNITTVLSDWHINHFDIKCDNVMLDAEGYPALADFGESMSYTNEKNCYTMLNKGTEWIKSPEMLSIALNSTITSNNFDRRKKHGAGPASDVWSIGCLFYELMTGEYLFTDSNWSRFFMRITEDNEPLLTEANIQKLPNDPKFTNFLEFVLQRNARSRPNIQQVIAKFNEMFPDAMNSPLPSIDIPNYQ